MVKVEHYRGLNTDLDNLYKYIKQAIEDEKDLRVVSEYKGTLNGVPMRSIVAVNRSAKVFVGSLAEIHISIVGNPDDYAVEVASSAWFSSLLFPGAIGFVVGGPIGLAAGLAAGGLMAYEFEKKIWKRISEIVKQHSQVQPTLESVDTYHQ